MKEMAWNARFGDLLSKWWTVGLIAAALQLAYALVGPGYSHSVWIESGVLWIVISLVLYRVDLYGREMLDAIRTSGLDPQLSSLQASLLSLKDESRRLKAGILNNLADDFLKVGVEGLESLAGFEQFDDSDGYLDEAIHVVTGLGAGDRIEAICGQKTWSKPRAQDYLKRNLQCAIAGAAVVRLFLTPQSGRFPVGEQDWIDQHQKLNLDSCSAVVLSPAESRNIQGLHGLPTGFGMTLVHRQAPESWSILLHWGMEDGVNAGKLIRSRELYAILRKRFIKIMHSIPADQRPPGYQ